MDTRTRALALFVPAMIVVALDQVTKAVALASLEAGETTPVIDGVLHWTLQRNPGAAFGIAPRFPLVFTILAAGISAAIIVSLKRMPDRAHVLTFGLVLGGAVGNLIDRIVRPPGVFRGHVIDFIDLRVWPVFNIADSAVVVGVLVLLIVSWRAERAAKAAAGEGEDEGDRVPGR